MPLINIQKFLLLSISISGVYSSEAPTLLTTEPLKNESRNSTVPPPFPFSLSSAYFGALATTEREIYVTLKEQSPGVLSETLVKDYLLDYEETEAIKGQDKSGRTRPLSPQRILRTVWRFVGILQPWLASTEKNNNTCCVDLKQLSDLKNEVQWPSTEDLYDVIEAILKIQFYYTLDLQEFVNGRIRGFDAGVRLSPEHVWVIARYALNNKFYSLVLPWLELISTEEPAEEQNVLEAKRLLQKKHDEDFSHLNETINKYIFTGPIGEEEPLSFPPTMRDHLLQTYLKTKEIQSPLHSFVRSIATCNGQNLQDIGSTPPSLKCYLDSERSPYFKLQPLKMEPLSLDPYVALTYDFVPESWTNILKTKASSMLRKSTPEGLEYAYETAAYAWLEDEVFQEISLIRKMEAITGLKVTGDEASVELQVAEYIFGGAINDHVDTVGAENLEDRGQVITTLLVYLSEVEEEQGGWTAFPLLGIGVRPQKRMMLWWYNSDRNGEVDARLLHGGCPLIWGEKWIANKWTHTDENMFIRPCTLTQSDTSE